MVELVGLGWSQWLHGPQHSVGGHRDTDGLLTLLTHCTSLTFVSEEKKIESHVCNFPPNFRRFRPKFFTFHTTRNKYYFYYLSPESRVLKTEKSPLINKCEEPHFISTDHFLMEI